MADIIKDLEVGLRIDEHALEEALLEQPGYFYRVSKEFALATSRRDAAKQAMDEIKAGTDLGIRKRAKTENEKLTEKEIEALVKTDKTVIEETEEYLNFSHEVGQLGALKEAYQQRSYVLKELTALYLANYYGDTTNNSTRTTMRDHRAEDIKRRLVEERRKQGSGK